MLLVTALISAIVGISAYYLMHLSKGADAKVNNKSGFWGEPTSDIDWFVVTLCSYISFTFHQTSTNISDEKMEPCHAFLYKFCTSTLMHSFGGQIHAPTWWINVENQS